VTIAADVTCCGALTHHMGERVQSQELMQQAVDGWDRLLNDGIEAIVLTTSGCQTAVADYGHIFAGTDREAAARRVSAATVDISQFVMDHGLPAVQSMRQVRMAYHDACSMQHGLQLTQPPRDLLQQTGVQLVEIPEGHICCGSAGTYHLLRADFADQLQQRKVAHIEQIKPDVVVTGNIGCMEQLAGGLRERPILHTVQWLDWATGGPCPEVLQHLDPTTMSANALSRMDSTS